MIVKKKRTKYFVDKSKEYPETAPMIGSLPIKAYKLYVNNCMNEESLKQALYTHYPLHKKEIDIFVPSLIVVFSQLSANASTNRKKTTKKKAKTISKILLKKQKHKRREDVYVNHSCWSCCLRLIARCRRCWVQKTSVQT